MIRCLILSRYGQRGASSRMRFGQFLAPLSAYGIEASMSPLLSDAYLDLRYRGDRRRYLQALHGYLGRLFALQQAKRFDVVWLEGETFPGLPSWFEQRLGERHVPYVVDYDDAVFHRYDDWPRGPLRKLYRDRFRRLLSASRAATVGNAYLGDFAASQGAPEVVRVPTVVDLARYRPMPAPAASDRPLVVGWIGSPTTTPYLRLIEPALAALAARRPVVLRTVGAAPLGDYAVPLDQRPWALDTEAEHLASIDIGIMPLPDEPWERGKCGYKLIQYMAMASPVIASPVGVNTEIVTDGVNGFLAAGESDWLRALTVLADSPEMRHSMGEAGRARVVDRYSLQAVVPVIADVLRRAAGR